MKDRESYNENKLYPRADFTHDLRKDDDNFEPELPTLDSPVWRLESYRYEDYSCQWEIAKRQEALLPCQHERLDPNRFEESKQRLKTLRENLRESELSAGESVEMAKLIEALILDPVQRYGYADYITNRNSVLETIAAERRPEWDRTNFLLSEKDFQRLKCDYLKEFLVFKSRPGESSGLLGIHRLLKHLLPSP